MSYFCRQIQKQDNMMTMKRIALLSVFLIYASLYGIAQKTKKSEAMYAVAFYNQENLFDTVHDAGKDDYQYLPDGSYKWTGEKYRHKVSNMARVLSMLGASHEKHPVRPAIIGLAEVENINVLRDLVADPALTDRNMKIVHIEGPDKRGIDCAFLVDSTQFALKDTRLVPYVYENGDTVHKTRGYLIARGELAGEDVAAIVCHWPSRAAGSEFREMAGRQVKAVKDSLLSLNPNMKILVMGDMNDDPDNKSMCEALGAKRNKKECGTGDLYNPWWDILRKKKTGTLLYRGNWNLFDQIVVSGNMLNSKKKQLSFLKPEIFRRDFLFQTEGKYKGSPKRTHAGGTWLNGYSDHLPVVLWMVKKNKK